MAVVTGMQSWLRMGARGVEVGGLADWPGWTFTVSRGGAITAAPPNGEQITSAIWRMLPIKTVLDMIERMKSDVWSAVLDVPTESDTAIVRPRGGSDEFSALVARIYRQALRSGGTVKPAEAIRERFQLSGDGRKTAERYIAEARGRRQLGSYEEELARAKAEVSTRKDRKLRGTHTTATRTTTRRNTK